MLRGIFTKLKENLKFIELPYIFPLFGRENIQKILLSAQPVSHAVYRFNIFLVCVRCYLPAEIAYVDVHCIIFLEIVLTRYDFI